MARQIIRPMRPARTALTTPLELPNLAAWYSLSGPAGDSTYIKDGSNRVQLIADRSGNSATNAFVSSGAASNTATTPTKSITGSQTITADVLFADYTPSANHTLFSKLSGNDGIEALLLTTGVLRLRIGDGAAVTNVDSTASVPISDLARATFALVWTDGVGASFTVNGAALGTAVAAAKTLTNASTTATIGTSCAGCIFRLQVGSVYDFNPASTAKLASTVVSGGDTWTINTSGDIGARICGARDLVQLTQAKQPIFSTSGGANVATFDGSNDYLKSAPFSFSRPESVYIILSQITWQSGHFIIDGNVDNTSQLYQGGSSPNIKAYAGQELILTTVPLGERALVTGIFNSTNSLIRKNRATPVTGDTGTTYNFNGVALGCGGGGGSASKITFSEMIMRSGADSSADQSRIAEFLLPRWGISG